MIFDNKDKEDKMDKFDKIDKPVIEKVKPDTAGQAANQAEFGIKGIYVRDSSFEAPHVPEVNFADWKPEVKFELNTQARKLEEDDFEVILKMTVTVKQDKKVCFLTEVQQAGLFTLRGFNDEQRGQMLGSFCPNVLYPYARESISNMATRGGYPPLYLAPVNFDALYADHLNRTKQQGATGTTGTTGDGSIN
jgi:preprotein translocase subunit SecB